jgi:hypothetical protein
MTSQNFLLDGNTRPFDSKSGLQGSSESIQRGGHAQESGPCKMNNLDMLYGSLSQVRNIILRGHSNNT